jgi:hypothetical protein
LEAAYKIKPDKNTDADAAGKAKRRGGLLPLQQMHGCVRLNVRRTPVAACVQSRAEKTQKMTWNQFDVLVKRDMAFRLCSRQTIRQDAGSND